MNDAILGVELACDAVKVLGVPGLVTSEHSIGNVVGELDHSGRRRVHEERRIRQVPDDSPACAQGSKLDRHLLKRRLVGIADALLQGSQRGEGATGGGLWQPGEPKAQRTAEAALPTATIFWRINRTVVNKSCGESCDENRGRC